MSFRRSGNPIAPPSSQPAASQQTQPAASQQQPQQGSDSSDDEVPEVSQRRLVTASKYINTLSCEEVDRKVADLVRYVLFMESSRTPIRRKDIVEKVLKEHSKGLPIFVQKTQETLRELFGMDLMLLPTRETKRSRGRAAGPAGAAAAAAQASSTSNAWVVLSTLTPQQREVALSMGQQDSRRMGLLSVILSLIFVSGRMLNEDVLFSYMKRLGVQRDGDHIHFGKIEGEMNNFVKLGYLERRRVRAPDGDTNSYVWGPRAKLEFSDARMVEFVTSGQYPAQAPYPAQQPYPPPPQAYPPPQQAYPAQPGYGQPAPGYGQPQQAYYPQQPPPQTVIVQESPKSNTDALCCGFLLGACLCCCCCD
ncbi:positive regulation of nitrogen compound metabolic process [Polyrhizophydium stewartii]|uniref:Positive regulation of nitrogen compound metabolic process n=1 Tax=Polyrhizophydium stewartii TaxID=2732419 RepID=A0ABR4N8D1_9FUNG